MYQNLGIFMLNFYCIKFFVKIFVILGAIQDN